MTRAIPQADSAAAVNRNHLLVVLDPTSDSPTSQAIEDVVRALFTQAMEDKLAGIAAGAQVNLTGNALQAEIDAAVGTAMWRSAHTVLRTAVQVRDLLDGLLGTGWREGGGGGGGISLDQAIDGVGAALAMLSEFSYDADTNTFTFSSAKLERQDDNPRSTPASRTGPWLPTQQYAWQVPGSGSFAEGEIQIAAPADGNRAIDFRLGADDLANGALAVMTELAAGGSRIKLILAGGGVAYEGTLIAGVTEVGANHYRINSTPISYAAQPDGTLVTVEVQSAIDVKNAAQDSAIADKAAQGSLDQLATRVTNLEGSGVGGSTENATLVELGELAFLGFSEAASPRQAGARVIGGANRAGPNQILAYADADEKLYSIDTPAGGCTVILADLGLVNTQAERAALNGSEFYLANTGDSDTAGPLRFEIGGIGSVFPGADAEVAPGTVARCILFAWPEASGAFDDGKLFNLYVIPFDEAEEKLDRYPDVPTSLRPAESGPFELTSTYAYQALIANRFQVGHTNYGNVARGQVMVQPVDGGVKQKILFRCTETDEADVEAFIRDAKFDTQTRQMHGLEVVLRDPTQASEPQRRRVAGTIENIVRISGQPAYIIQIENVNVLVGTSAGTALELYLGDKIAVSSVYHETSDNAPPVARGRDGWWAFGKAAGSDHSTLWRKASGAWSRIATFWRTPVANVHVSPLAVETRTADDFTRKFNVLLSDVDLTRLVTVGALRVEVEIEGREVYSAAWAATTDYEQHLFDFTVSAQNAAMIAQSIGAGNNVAEVDVYWYDHANAGAVVARAKGHIVAGVPELVPPLRHRVGDALGASPVVLPEGTEELALLCRVSTSGNNRFIEQRVLLSNIPAAARKFFFRGEGGDEIAVQLQYAADTRTLTYSEQDQTGGAQGAQIENIKPIRRI